MNQDLFNELARATLLRASGAVEWQDARRRRLFFFRNGALVLIQSNLRSESPERVTERSPGLSPEVLTQVVASVRLRDALGEDAGEVRFHPDAPAPAFEPHDLAFLLWGSVLPPPPFTGWPRAVGTYAILSRLPVESALLTYLQELDGSRPMADVLEFSPADPATTGKAITIGLALGAIELDDAPTPSARAISVGRVDSPPPVAPSPPARTAPAASPVTVDDIADMIRGALTDQSASSAPTTESTAPSNLSFGGSSATVTLGGGRPVVVPSAAKDPLTERFGSALTRIRDAKDHFTVLGTTWQDAPESHRRAYFALAQLLHPDRFATENPDVCRVAAELFEPVRGAWEVLGDDLRREAYIARVIRGEKSEDEKAMDQVRTIMDAETDFKRGIAELNGGRLPSAHEHFVRAAAILPEDLELGCYAAFTTFRLNFGRDDAVAKEAARRVAAAVQANDKLDNLWVLYGIVLRTTGNDGGARKAFVSALKLKPTNPDAAREMKRLEREREASAEVAENKGLFSRFFKKK